MSARGIKFLHQWIQNNIPVTAKAVSIHDLTYKLFADAKAVGIKRAEIDDGVESLYRTLFKWTVHSDPGA